ncbi:peroxiredoxin family protein [Urechidicola croceus]|uniref:Thioredoxin domain-containing protein n=1 Tax=Urechidicola croceus TaxID=1850246 RepID=A0A1D8PAS2_9FLAO|nr:redoxin domain-containing protein [Urechidicola croceus]AOW21641.1 hypothetical protein LPB138_13545 [Urechidicola croceus]
MKKVSLFITFITTFFFINGCNSTKKVSTTVAKTIPYFTFTTLDNQNFTKDSFDKKRTKLILYFNSECEHCQKQGDWLSKEIESFKDLELVFISFEEIDAIKKFRDSYNFNQENLTFLQDTRLTFSYKFGVDTFPSILIYSKNGKLIKAFEGETKPNKIFEFIK